MGWWNLLPRTRRWAPTRWATVIRQVITAQGMPARSISLASVDPLRVPVPQVAERITAVTPASFISLAIVRPIPAITSILPPLPTVA